MATVTFTWEVMVVRVPAYVTDLASFRRWTDSEEFPESGRIDWIGGEVDVDMSPEDLTTHGTLKVALARDISLLVEPAGVVVADRSRLSSPRGDLSVEPDIVVVTCDAIESGRTVLVPKASGEPGRYREIEGSVDLIVECVSDSSRTKDRVALREHYHRAGILEYWIVDARRADRIDLTLLHHEPSGWADAPADADGYRASRVLGRAVRIARVPLRAGLVTYRLETRANE